jgi:hypothetical protein
MKIWVANWVAMGFLEIYGTLKTNCYQRDGRVAEWFKAPVLKTGRGLCSLVSSNLTPSATSSLRGHSPPFSILQ